MAVAFHILAHRQPAQVSRVLAALWHPENTYVIHYDRRRPAVEHAAIRALAASRENILIQSPGAVLWGRYSLYAAQHEGLRLALQSGRQWTHWFNVSGQCFPLLRPEAIHTACREAGDVSYVRHFQPLVKGDWSNPAARLTGWHFDSPSLEHVLRLPGLGRRLRVLFGGADSIPKLPFVSRALPTGFTWYGGDNWVTLSREAADYLVSSPESARIIAALRRSALPEESIFQTVLLNSPLAPKVRNDHRRAIKWQENLGSPKTFDETDFPALAAAAAQGHWLARKFTADSPVLARVERELLSHA
jgi:hypothetical protein